MSKITVVAKIVAKEENRELVKTELLKLVASSVQEAVLLSAKTYMFLYFLNGLKVSKKIKT